MKKLLFSLLLLIMCAAFAGATTITIQTFTINSYNYSGSTATLRIIASSSFVDSDGNPVVGGSNFYKIVNCTVNTSTKQMVCPQFTLPSTTDSSDPYATFTATIYDAAGVRRETLFSNWRIPTSLGATVSFAQLQVHNSAPIRPPNPAYYDRNATDILIAASRAAIMSSEEVRNKLSCFTPEYYGAIANDLIDDKAAIQTAYNAATAAKGALCLQAAEYRISSAIELASNTAIIGLPSAGLSAGGSRIVLTASNQAIFHVGENILNVNFENVDFSAANGLTNTKGVSFTGSAPNSSQFFDFNKVAFRNFTYGIFIDALDGSNNWQVESLRIIKSNFTDNTYAVKVEAANAGIQIYDSVFYLPAGGYGVHANAIGIFKVVNSFAARNYTTYCDSFGASYPYTPVYNSDLGEAFIYINGPHSTVYLETILAEGVKYTLVNNYELLTHPITVVDSILTDVRLNADTRYISIGNTYYVNTLEASGATNDTRIESYGDAIQSTHKCNAAGIGTGFVISGGVRIIEKSVINGKSFPLTAYFGDVSEPANADDSSNSAPKVAIGVSSTLAAQGKPFFRMGETSSSSFTHKFDFFRNQTNGYLTISPSQAAPYKGVEIDGSLQLKKQSTYIPSEADTAKLVLDNDNILRLCVNASPTCDPVTDVNPKWFGAKGDGSTDDATAIQNTLNVATPLKLPVKFEPGTYMIGTQINLASNTHIILSKGAELKARSGIADLSAILLLSDLDNVTIEGNGIINGNKAGLAGSHRVTPIVIQGGSRLTFKGITIKNGASHNGSYGDGMYIGSGFNVLTSTQDLLIDGVTFDGNERNGIQTPGCRQCRFVNSVFQNTTDDGSGVLGPSAGINFENNPQKVDVTDGVTNGTTTITSATANFNDFAVANSPLVTIYLPANGGIYQANIVSITNNTTIVVDVAPTFTATGLSMSVTHWGFEKFEDVVVSGNHFYNNAGGGVIVDGRNNRNLKNFIISNNTFKDNANIGLSVNGSFADGFIISGNSISGTTGTCSSVATTGKGQGLTLAGFDRGVSVTGNDIYDNHCTGVLISGSAHYNVLNNKITRNKAHGIYIRTDTTLSASIGASATLGFNQIFNNGWGTANTYDGIQINGNPTYKDVGLTVMGNWIGNDPFINYTPTQRYSVYLADNSPGDVQNIHFLFNNHLGNLSGKVVAQTGNSINTVLELQDFTKDTYRNVLLQSVNGNSGGTLVTPHNTPAQLTGNTNDYAINGQSYVIEISSNGAIDLTGIVAGSKGETHSLFNVGSYSITLKNGSASSSAANRFFTTTQQDVVLRPFDSIQIYYNTTYSKWHLIAKDQALFGSASLDFSSISAQTDAELTITVNGAATGDKCNATPSGAPESGLGWQCYVSSSNTVTLRLTNITAGAIDPASRTWLVEVKK